MNLFCNSFRCLAATLAVAGVLRETTAQETLTIEYTTRVNSWSEPVRHFVEVEKDIRELRNYSGDIPVSHFSMMTTLIFPEGMTSLETLTCLFGPFSSLTNIVLPKGMTSLESLNLSHSRLTNIVLPEDMTSLKRIDIYDNLLTNIVLPEDMTSLEVLNLNRNRFTHFVLPEDMTSLRTLQLDQNRLTNIVFPEGLTSLEVLHLQVNQLTNIVLPKGLSNLKQLRLSENQLTTLTLPEGLTSLKDLRLPQVVLLRVPSGMNTNYLDISITRGWSTKSKRFGRWLEEGESVDPPFRIEFYGSSAPDEPDEPSPPRLSYRRLANGLELSWEGGTLQSAPTIIGPWQDVGSSGGAFKLFSSSPAEFFRVKP